MVLLEAIVIFILVIYAFWSICFPIILDIIRRLSIDVRHGAIHTNRTIQLSPEKKVLPLN